MAADALLYIVFTQHLDEKALYDVSTDATEKLAESVGNVVNEVFRLEDQVRRRGGVSDDVAYRESVGP